MVFCSFNPIFVENIFGFGQKISDIKYFLRIPRTSLNTFRVFGDDFMLCAANNPNFVVFVVLNTFRVFSEYG